ncbi:heavy metal translocating P-type ATPase [Candidatus Neomarinimicrobiota bacterium]
MSLAQHHIGEQTACFHCGDNCPTDRISIEDKVFCCHGCKTVYEILRDSNLLNYYDLNEKTPGITPDAAANKRKYAFLDETSVAERLLDFGDDRTSRATFRIPAIHCSSCIWLLENLQRLDKGVVRSQVNFPRRELAVVFKTSQMSLRQLVELLARIGYPPILRMDGKNGKLMRKADRQLYYRIGIAGFAFGNIMLFSFPGYLSGRGGLDPQFSSFFGYLNVLLALPVFFYSSLEYFRSAWKGLRNRYLNIDVPITLGIMVLFIQSLYEIFSHTGAGYLDSFSGLVFFLLIGKLFQRKTYDALSFDLDYRAYFPLSATVIRPGGEEIVPLEKIQKGDRILVRNQELLPADGVMVQGPGSIDYSFVTGESDVTIRNEGDPLFAGGRVIGPAIQMEIIREVSQSYLTRLWNHDVFTKPSRSRLTPKIDLVSRYFTLIVLGIAALSGGYWAFIDMGTAARVITAVLIVACPCALALAAPFALGTAQRVFGFHHFYLKNSDAVETLAGIDTIIFDKTGTLTQTRQSEIAYHGEPLSIQEQGMVRSLARHSSHVLSRQLHTALAGDVELAVDEFDEVPGAGLTARIDNAVIRLGSADWTLAERNGGSQAQTATSEIFVSINGKYRGVFQVARSFRKGLDSVARDLSAKFPLTVLSGDNDRDRDELRQKLGPEAELHFEQSPEDKLDFIRKQQAEGHHVLMIGDGLNDAGALKASDVGISISEDINNFSPACDGILAASRFRDLPQLIQFARDTLKIVYLGFGISFLYNLVGLSFAVSGMLSPLVAAVLMPVSSVSVVTFSTMVTRMRSRRYRLR